LDICGCGCSYAPVSGALTVAVSGTVSVTVTVLSLPIGGCRRILARLADGVGAFPLALHARMHPPLLTLTVSVTVTVTVCER
jgi:hypothetical protein